MLLTIRHGERADLVVPQPPIKILFDAQLTDKGKEQASQTGKFLKSYISERIKDPLIYVYSSPFLRVLQTAARIVKELDGQIEGGAVRISNAICEHLSAEYYSEHPLSKINSSIEPDSFISEEMEGVPFTREFQEEFGTPAFPETELEKLFARFSKSFAVFQKKHFGSGGEAEEEQKIDPDIRKRTIVILVSHGASIESWAHYFKDTNFGGQWPYCCISAVELNETGEWVQTKSADDSHLK